MEELFEIDDSLCIPKYLQLVKVIENWINAGIYKCGDKLPSINEISADFDISRDTTDKAFKDLKDRGIISSTKGKGYYVSKNHIANKLFIGIFMNRMTNYNEVVYMEFYNFLKDYAFIDLNIYHNNVQILEDQINRYSKTYDYFVITPIVDSGAGMIDAIKQLPKNKIIIMKRILNEFKGMYPAVYQDYYYDTIQALNEINEEIAKYRCIHMIINNEKYSSEITKGFITFCKINYIDYSVEHEIREIIKGDGYFILDDADMVNFIEMQRKKNYILGKDIGLISYEDNPIKKLLSGGITAINLNNKEIGRLTAKMILENDFKKIRVPVSMIKRASF